MDPLEDNEMIRVHKAGDPRCIREAPKFPCVLCKLDFGYMTQAELDRHLRAHSDFIQCYECDEKLSTKNEYGKHKQTQHGLKPIQKPQNTKPQKPQNTNPHQTKKIYLHCDQCDYGCRTAFAMKIHVDNHHGVQISINLNQLNRENLKGIFGTEDLSDSDEDPSFDPANEDEDDEDVNLKKRKKTFQSNISKKVRNEKHFVDHAQEQRETTTTTTTTKTQTQTQTQNTKTQRVNCEIYPCEKTFTRTSDMKRHMKNVRHPTVPQKKTQPENTKFLD